MNTAVLILELIGTVAFSFSGAMTAIGKKMDLFGVIVLGVTTAIGGGVIRDLLLGATPPATFQHPIYTIVAVVTAIAVFLPFGSRLWFHTHQHIDRALLLMDSLGLGIFTVVGVRAAFVALEAPSGFLAAFVGVLTGVGGGILRDVMAGDTPYVFVKHFYATASIIGAILSVVIYPLWGEGPAMAMGGIATLVLRLLAARFRWGLPKAHTDA